MIKTYFNLKIYDKYIVTKHLNPRNRGHPPNCFVNVIDVIFSLLVALRLLFGIQIKFFFSTCGFSFFKF